MMLNLNLKFRPLDIQFSRWSLAISKTKKNWFFAANWNFLIPIGNLSPNLKFEPRFKSSQKPISIERQLKSWNIEYICQWNQPYLSRVSNLSRGS